MAAAQKVRDSFDGSIRWFLENPLGGTNQEDHLWLRVIDIVSIDEKVLMIWLMLKPLSYEEIKRLRIPNLPEQRRVNAFQSLRRRGLIEAEKH